MSILAELLLADFRPVVVEALTGSEQRLRVTIGLDIEHVLNEALEAVLVCMEDLKQGVRQPGRNLVLQFVENGLQGVLLH